MSQYSQSVQFLESAQRLGGKSTQLASEMEWGEKACCRPFFLGSIQQAGRQWDRSTAGVVGLVSAVLRCSNLRCGHVDGVVLSVVRRRGSGVGYAVHVGGVTVQYSVTKSRMGIITRPLFPACSASGGKQEFVSRWFDIIPIIPQSIANLKCAVFFRFADILQRVNTSVVGLKRSSASKCSLFKHT